uniref:Uncharacterized protein n=1 Tax=Onchocerca volvulus TaxID=6282 RepID=A0A8R1XTE1_ONCVO
MKCPSNKKRFRFIICKLPKLKSQIYPGATSYYADKDTNEWGPPENYLITIYSLQKSFFFFCNDQKPGETKSHGNRAQAKDVTFFGKTSGFWLIHSVTRFPSNAKYSYPKNGEVYGQSFLCVTMKTESIGTFAEAMKYIDPAVYQMNLPKNFSDRFLFLKELKILKKKNNPNSSLIQTFSSIGSLKFYDFLKTKKYDGDIVINVRELKIGGSKFGNNKNHSKCAVSQKETKPLVCIADINRQESQKKRAGGALCFENLKIWKLFEKSILNVEDCDA